jgi:Fe-S cluster assembly protein SufD
MTDAPKIITRKKSSRGRQALADFRFSRDQLPKLDYDLLNDYHQAAWEAYAKLPFPSLKDEPWRRTDIRGLNSGQFELLDGQLSEAPPSRYLNPIVTGEQRVGQIVSGAVETQAVLEDSLKAQGVIFTDFASGERDHPELLNSLLDKIVSPDEDKFTALAAALAQNGVFLFVPKNVVIDQPLHSLYWGGGENLAYINHILVWLEEGAEVTFVHESASPQVTQEESQLLHTGIVELHVGRNARLNFVELQSWGKNVWSFTRERAQVMGDGNLEWIFGAMGTHLTKNFSDIDLIEPGAMGRMSGFYFTSGNQHLDHDTQQNHKAVNTTSDLLYKGALKDQSRSVWQGMIYVAPGAIGTDGYQANRNLVLSQGARADSIPGLEILADDVRCTHGATVGKIDEDQLFYLYSRGIQEKEAELLIVMGFFDPIMARIPFEGVQIRFKNAIREKMSD